MPAIRADRWWIRSRLDIESIERRMLDFEFGRFSTRWNVIMKMQKIGIARTVGNLSKKR